jgi:hypothetical protein
VINLTFNSEQRKELAKKGVAKPDGSFPIRNANDRKNAIKDWGRAGSSESDKSHIIKRAKAIGAEEILPDSWKADAADIPGEPTSLIWDLCNQIGKEAEAISQYTFSLHSSPSEETAGLFKEIRKDELEHIQALVTALTELLEGEGGESEAKV